MATTLVTSEGRALTEVSLWVRNRAQPIAKVALPPGASMVSVEVAGQPAKPVEGKDGTRVPLLRPGFRPDGPYNVSFVYLHAGAPFAKKGNMQMTLPKMDMPVSVVEWELFIPDRYRADRFDGNAIAASLMRDHQRRHGVGGGRALESARNRRRIRRRRSGGRDFAPVSGQIVGRVVDSAGGVLPGVTITAVVPGALRRRSPTRADCSRCRTSRRARSC